MATTDASNILNRYVYAHPKPQNQWDHFEYGVKLTLSRWTALRMAVEGEWGGGDIARKYEVLLEEIFALFKYQKNVYVDDLVNIIEEYIDTEFYLVCEDGSVDEVGQLLVLLAEQCKSGNFSMVTEMMNATPVQLSNLKQSKRTTDELLQEQTMPLPLAGPQNKENHMNTVDEDGWATVPRKSTRTRVQPKFYDPAAEFPGAM